MQKKRLAALMAAAVIALSGCGVSPSVIDDLEYLESLDKERAETASTEVKESSTETSKEDLPKVEDTDPEPNFIKFNIVELTPDQEYTVEGNFILKNMYSDVLTDRSVADGWTYYYSEGEEERVPTETWVPRAGSHTSMEVIVTLENIKEPMTETYTDSFRGFWAYNIPYDLTLLKIENYSTEEMCVSLFGKLSGGNGRCGDPA